MRSIWVRSVLFSDINGMMAVHVCDVVTPEILTTRGTDAGVRSVIRYVMNSITGIIAVA